MSGRFTYIAIQLQNFVDRMNLCIQYAELFLYHHFQFVILVDRQGMYD